MQSIYLDTNVVIDFLGERHPFYNSSAVLLSLADKKEIKLFTSPLTIATTHYILSQYEKSQIIVEKIKKFRILCSVTNLDETIVDKALTSDFTDFEDAIQYYSAIDSQCDIIISRNEKDFERAKIPILNPKDYLKSINYNE